MEKTTIQISLIISLFVLVMIFSPTLEIRTTASAPTGACPSQAQYGSLAYNYQCFLGGAGNWIITTSSASIFTTEWTVNETFSNYASGSSATLPGCSTATSDQESFDAQLNYYQSGVSFPWTQQILGVNTINGNSCHTVEYWPTSGSMSPDCAAQMIGGSTYDPNFNTSRSATYNEFYPEASSGTMSAWYVETFNPSDTWVIYPGSSSPNGCGSGSGGGTGLPSSISSWSTSSPKGEFTFVFVGFASGSGYVGFSRFSTSPSIIDGDLEPYFMMQVWYDQADTSPIPTQIDQQTGEQSNTIYSNAYVAPKASPDGATAVLTQEVNCLLTAGSPSATYYCA